MTKRSSLFPAFIWAIISLTAAAPSPARAQSAGERASLLAADPQATEAGLGILKQGGSAADMAIAAAMVLAVVSPQSAGPGGVGGALSFKASSGTIHAWDGSSVAPAAAGPDLFVSRDGKPMVLRDLVPGGRAVGVPSQLRLLEALHRASGHLPWDRLITPAIALAEDGYTISPDLAALLANGNKIWPDSVLTLFRDPAGQLPKAGDQRRNPALAETLRMIAASGADAVLRGRLAADIASVVRNDANPGLITADDLTAFVLPERAALCTPYRTMKLCSLGPPDAGGTLLMQSLALLDRESLPRLDPAGTESARLLLQAWRRASTSTLPGLADPDMMAIRVEDLLAPARTASLIAARRGAPEPPAMLPSIALQTQVATVLAVDHEGNAVSLALTLQSPFGAQIATHGFILNNALTGFAAQPMLNGQPVTNHVDGSRRPLQTLAPLLGLDAKGALRLVGGGGREDSALGLAQVLIRLIDFHLAPRIAMAAPIWHLTPRRIGVDDVLGAKALADALRGRGEIVAVQPPSARLMLLSVGDTTTQARATTAYGRLAPSP